MAYPELVSGGVPKSHKFKWLVKVGASKGVIRVDLKKKSWPRGFPDNQKTLLDMPLYYNTGFSYVTNDVHCGMAHAKQMLQASCL